jgi:hypothetical protein
VRAPFLTLLIGTATLCCDSRPQDARLTRPGGESPAETLVSRPTLIGAFVGTQAQIDSNPQANEALADYQYYLSRAVPILEQHGVAVITTNDSIVRWRDSLGHHSRLAADSGGILYLFVLPSGRLKTLHAGVEVDGALLATARDHFGLPIPVPRLDSL